MEWSNFWAMLIGGGISLITSLVVLEISFRKDREIRCAEKRIEKASFALQELGKLGQLYQSVHAIDVTLKENFQRIQESGHEELPPGVKVTPLIAIPEDAPPLDVVNLSFLMATGKSALFNEILQFELRVRNITAAVTEFSNLRKEYEDRISERIVGGDMANFSGDGQKASIHMEGQVGQMFQARVSVLTSLIERITKDVEKAVLIGKKVLSDYTKAASLEFGENFPARQVSFGDKNADP